MLLDRSSTWLHPIISNRYRPTLPVEFLVPELGFSDRDECIEFLKEMNVTLTTENSKIDCKASMAVSNSL